MTGGTGGGKPGGSWEEAGGRFSGSLKCLGWTGERSLDSKAPAVGRKGAGRV